MNCYQSILGSAAAGLLAFSWPAQAQVSLNFDSRNVNAGYSVTTPVEAGNLNENVNRSINSFGDFSPFDAAIDANFDEGGLSLSAAADQVSEVTPTLITGEGSASANAGGNLGQASFASANAGSSMFVDFEVTEPTEFRLTGGVNAAGDDAFSVFSRVSISSSSFGGGGINLSVGADPNTGAIPFDFAGILPGGFYTLSAEAVASADPAFGNTGSSQYSFLLELAGAGVSAVPIPGAALLFGSSTLVLLGGFGFRKKSQPRLKLVAEL